MRWCEERGPIGGPRWDHYLKVVAMHAGGPYTEEQSFDAWRWPWEPPPEPDDD